MPKAKRRMIGTPPRHLVGVVPFLPFLEEPPAEVDGIDRAERLEDADDHRFRWHFFGEPPGSEVTTVSPMRTRRAVRR